MAVQGPVLLAQNSVGDIAQTEDGDLRLVSFDGLVHSERDRGQYQRKFSINIMSLLV